MKIKKRSVGRPRQKETRLRYNLTLLPKIRKLGDKIAFENNVTFSRYIENLILADVAKKGA